MSATRDRLRAGTYIVNATALGGALIVQRTITARHGRDAIERVRRLLAEQGITAETLSARKERSA